MGIIIYKAKEPMRNLVYSEWPTRVMHANKTQERKINELREKNPKLAVIPHARKNCNDALISLNQNEAVWVFSNGHIKSVNPPSPFCYGNPTLAHCVVYGFCRRRPACND